MNGPQLDAMMLKWREILNDLDLRFALSCSTLLGIYRDKHQIAPNRSIDLVCLAEDLTKEKFDELTSRNDFYQMNPSRTQYGLLYFDDSQVEIQPVYFINGYAVYNLVGDTCLIYPEKHFRSFDTIHYLGLDWLIPHDPEGFLEAHYGNWKIPQSFYWSNDCKNIVKYQDLISEGGEKND